MQIDAIWQPEAQQKMFRLSVEAMSRPGSVQTLPPMLHDTSADKALLAMLLDAEVSLSDVHERLPATFWSLLQAKQADPAQADYIICDGARIPDFQPHLGTLSCPDTSATIMLVIHSVTGNEMHANLCGPGIEEKQTLALDGLNPAWLEARRQWVCAFPLGVDIMLLDDRQFVGLPRTTIVELC